MQISLNGAQHTVPADSTLSFLLSEANLQAKRIAVEINQQIIPRAEHAAFKLSEGDQVEIIHAVGGG